MPELYNVGELIIYQECNITPVRNCKVDNIENYLAGLQKIKYDRVQMTTEMLQLNCSMKLSTSIYNQINKSFNYAKLTLGLNIYYYFIEKIVNVGESQMRVFMKMDTVNTFWPVVKFSDKSHITRQHKDRFVTKTVISGVNTLVRKIDRIPEEFNPQLFKTSSALVTQTNYNYDWYLIYKTKNPLSTTNISNPLSCYLCASVQLNLNVYGPNSKTLTANDFPGAMYLFYYNVCSGTVSIGGTTITLSTSACYFIAFVSGGNINLVVFDSSRTSQSIYVGYTITLTGDFPYMHKFIDTTPSVYANNVLDIRSLQLITQLSDYTYIGVGGQKVNQDITSIDKTDSKIMKIIALPYCPTDDVSISGSRYIFDQTVWEYDTTMQMLKLKDLNYEFNNQIASMALPVGRQITKYSGMEYDTAYIDNESKLFNSQFYQTKFYYDSFSKVIPMEDINTNNPAMLFDIYFKMSNQMNSRFMFYFDFGGSGYTWASSGDYPEYMIVSRNNEIALYNNDYLNYMRTGYNYDIKAKNQQLAFSALGAGIGAVGAVAGIASGGAGVAALAIGTILSSATSLVNQAIRADDSIAQKMKQLQSQSGNVSANDDFNLMAEYTSNRLASSVYEVSTHTKNALFNYLRLCGYADNVYGVPDVTTRYWYNFIQFTPEYEEFDGAPLEMFNSQELIDNFRERCQAGVTVFHNHNGSINWNQDYENWEVWIV